LPSYDPHITYDDILKAKKELEEKYKEVHDDIMHFGSANNKTLPTEDEIKNNQRAHEILIGDKEKVHAAIESTAWKDSFRSENGFLTPEIPQLNEKDFYSVFMRHSIRAEQYWGSATITIPQSSKLYTHFYPEENKWDDEPVLSDLGLFLAYAEGMRMREAKLIFHRIESSPYIRCIQTALMVALAMGVKEIHINIALGEKLHVDYGGGFADKLNFYKKYPENNDSMSYHGIRIVSDGKPMDKIQFKEREFVNYFLSETREENVFFVGHGAGVSFPLPNNGWVSSFPYAFTVGYLNKSKDLFFSLRMYLESKN
jgi:hypothetical protein